MRATLRLRYSSTGGMLLSLRGGAMKSEKLDMFVVGEGDKASFTRVALLLLTIDARCCARD